MSRRNLIIAVTGGLAAAAFVTHYFGSEKGKQLLSSARSLLKDLSGKATEFAKDNLSGLSTGKGVKTSAGRELQS